MAHPHERSFLVGRFLTRKGYGFSGEGAIDSVEVPPFIS